MSEELTSTIWNIAKGIADGNFQNETAIRQGVVLPILQKLNWPIFEPQVVAPEFRIGDGAKKVDYALCHPPGKASVLIEVKDLGKADGKGQKQLFEYCFHKGVPIAVLTDGHIWSFFYPFGAGDYKERMFAEIDLLDEDPSAAVRAFARYLDWEAVKSRAAGKRAQQDYEEAQFQKQAASKFASVWRKLLSKPEESLLLELFLEAVGNEIGRQPDRERAAEFIRERARDIGAASGTPPKTSKRRSERARKQPSEPSAPPRPTVQKPKPSPPSFSPSASAPEQFPYFTFEGRTEAFKKGVDCFVAVFNMFAERYPGFCEAYSERYRGKKNKYVARTKEELYPSDLSGRSAAVLLPGGWWLYTKLNNPNKEDRIKEACELVGLKYGRDLKVHIPVGSRKKKSE